MIRGSRGRTDGSQDRLLLTLGQHLDVRRRNVAHVTIALGEPPRTATLLTHARTQHSEVPTSVSHVMGQASIRAKVDLGEHVNDGALLQRDLLWRRRRVLDQCRGLHGERIGW